MLEDFLSYIEQELSLNKNDKVLLAISGGVDSMVMLDLFIKSEFPIEVAHVNHSTREGASDVDQEFVRDYCLKFNIPFHTTTLNYSDISSGNFQANAREARYSFFTSIIQKQHIDFLATAHHKDDRWETFILNLNRKSGLKGLSSLRPRLGSVIRPLLCFDKNNIITYALKHNTPYREDISNASDDYLRNQIRHSITPAVEKVMPDFVNNANEAIRYLEREKQLLSTLILNLEVLTSNLIYTKIDLKKVRQFPLSQDLLFHILSEFTFTFSDAKDILENDSSGALFISKSHEALRQQNELIIRLKVKKIFNEIVLKENGEYELQDGRLIYFTNSESVHIEQSNVVSFPIHKGSKAILRSLKPGDKYKPEHMNGKSKSLKKLLSDHKVNRFEKEAILVLEIDNEIKKVIGLKKGNDNYK